MGEALSSNKSYFVLFGSVIVCLLVLELLSAGVYQYYHGVPFSQEAVHGRLFSSVSEVMPNSIAYRGGLDLESALIQNTVLHPYVGFAADYSAAPVKDPFDYSSFSNQDDVFAIGIFGGSVAGQVHSVSGVLASRLATLPDFAGTSFDIMTFTFGGVKQPQQLMALTYLLSLGKKFDLVINLDGFNEVALPFGENRAINVTPSFPRQWVLYSLAKGFDVRLVASMGKYATILGERSSLQEVYSRVPLRYSVFFLTLWDFLDARKEKQLRVVQEQAFEILQRVPSSYQTQSAQSIFSNDVSYFEELGRIWRDSSLQMHRLSLGNNFTYFHFLQPNQYVNRSKPLSAAERRFAYYNGSEPFFYRDAVYQGYATLTYSGQLLKEQGVQFYDLTMMFENETRTVYKDMCCHFNDLGIQLLTEHISQKLVEFY